jgi:hypothetical protein
MSSFIFFALHHPSRLPSGCHVINVTVTWHLARACLLGDMAWYGILEGHGVVVGGWGVMILGGGSCCGRWQGLSSEQALWIRRGVQ